MTEKNDLTQLKNELQKLQSAIQSQKGLKGMISDEVLDGILRDLESRKQDLENRLARLSGSGAVSSGNAATAPGKHGIAVGSDVHGSVLISGNHNTVAGNGSTIIRTGGIHANVINAVNVVNGVQVNEGTKKQGAGIQKRFQPPPAPPSREGRAANLLRSQDTEDNHPKIFISYATWPETDSDLFQCTEDNHPKIFISYATEDYETAQKLYEDLKDSGLTPWMDREDLLPGQNWRLTITRVIRECKTFIALLSSNSLSKRGFVQKELKMALDILDEFPSSEIFLVPVQLDRCEPQEDKLRDLHRVDLSASYEKGVEKILQSLAQIHNEHS